MKKLIPQKSNFTRRSLILGAFQMGITAVIGWRMYELGVKHSYQYRLLAEENRINIRLIPPTRGLIYDRNGNLIALNRQVYTIEIVREQTQDPRSTLKKLAELIPLSDQRIENILAEMSRQRAFVPVSVATGLEWEHIAAISVNTPVLPGITPHLALQRQYPLGADFAHIVGYIGSVSDYDLKQREDKDPLLLIPRFKIGKNGIEAKAEKILRGKAGLKRIEVNAVGRVMRELDRQKSISGGNLQITVDSKLQTYAQNRIQGQSAAVVVMDIYNGDILTLASAPSFDPNKFVNGISVSDWRALNDNKFRPLANKTIQGLYPPGSTFKMIVALAALQEGIITKTEQIYCPGHTNINGRKFHCWRPNGHGKMNLQQAIRHSCDVYFYNIAIRVGIEKITQTAKILGLGIQPNLPLPAAQKGLLPTKEWKLRTKKENWFIGDTANAAIGQGFVLASPIQLANMTARLASGHTVSPRLFTMIKGKIISPEKTNPLPFDSMHLDHIRKGMFEVVNHIRGTAYHSRLPISDKMAGKTGTSQVRYITKAERETSVIKNKDLPWERRDHALFVGYAPFDNPKYAISVIVEHGGSGSKVAAPIAKDIMTYVIKESKNKHGTAPNQKQSYRFSHQAKRSKV